MGTTIDSTSSSTSSSSYLSSAYSSLNTEDFLKLYLAEINNQDPTDPVDTSEMVNSFATLSQLSLQQTANSFLSSISEMTSSLSNASASNYLNKTVTYSCDEIAVSGYSAS